jgi:formamidopyrimidine-DNA glycosylase
LWRPPGALIPRKTGIFAFDFGAGTLVVTEPSTRHRASLHLVAGEGSLDMFRRGGVDVLSLGPQVLAGALRRENRTLKRALTDPDIVDGIGNKFSDEILHRARLSPFALTAGLRAAEIRRLHGAAVDVLSEWTGRLRAEAGDGFPPKGTELRSEMAVHGRYGRPCPVCGAPVQRIVYAESESNYCPGCQTGGRILADRSLSRLLKDDWPKTLEQLERLHPGDSRTPGR